jgi:hypothetical protein
VYSPQLVVELSRLLVMEVDAVRAYANAVALLGPGPIRDELALIGKGHAEHAAALRGEIAFRGYVAPDPTSRLEGYVLGSSGPPGAPPAPEEALAAVLRNEQLAGSMYAKLLAKGPPENALELVERHRAEAERHRSWAERTLNSGGHSRR